MNTSRFDFCLYSGEMFDAFPDFTKKNFHVGFYLNTVYPRSFNLLVIITLLGVCTNLYHV